MQLFEVKNDIAKIVYNPTENHLLPSDFLLLEDSNQKLIAQIINISTTESSNNNLADVRLSLSIDKDDNLSYYNGYIPSKSSSVVYINPDEIIELIKGSGENIYLGNLSNHSECFVKPSRSFIDDKVYIQSDRDDKTKTIVQNIISELYAKQRKVILLDFDGRYSSIVNVPRVKIAESFKLPLNIEAFNTILEYDVVDCPIEDKAVIQSIVLELREYLKTIENKFLPFTLFKNVVDNEFMSNPISGLMLLRNKLWLYAQESIFAESKSQFDIINAILEKQNILVIDASNLEEKWYKFAIQTIIELVNKHCYFALSLNDVPMDKKAIISLYNTSNIIPIVSTTYDSKYRQILKSVCKNQILFKPSNSVSDEESYNVLLNKINSGEFIVYGESTLYLPLILELQSFDSSTSEEVIQNEIKKDVDKLLSSPQKIIPTEMTISEDFQRPMSNNLEQNTDESSDIIEDDFNDSDLDFLDEQNEEKITIDDIRNKKPVQEVKDNQYDVFAPMSVQESKVAEEAVVDDVKIDSSAEELIEIDVTDDTVVPLNEENDALLAVDETFPSLDDEVDNNSVVLPMGVSSASSNVVSTSENIEDKVDVLDALDSVDSIGENVEDSNEDIADLDSVISNIESSIEEKQTQEHNETVEKKEEKEFLVELETEDEEVAPPPIKEKINTNSSPELPVYETDNSSEIQISDVPFKIGDKVYHPKHGNGVIEGFANYSNKILFCQIEFENVGRRILDPRVSGIEKIS